MRKVLSVTELNDQIKILLEESIGHCWVEGEVSNVHKPASGHTYFTLKDDKSQVRAVIFRPFPGKKPFPRPGAALFALEEGMKVLCLARLSVYQPRGEYQLIVDSLEPLGSGALQKAFEQLKSRLQEEGLFDPAHKKPLPFLPSRIGVITSPTGAVIRDILHVTERRFSSVDILVAPVRVQGSESPEEIIRAIGDLNSMGYVDVIILARGGGSLEDMAPFNDERVARAIFHSPIPVVSAIGHETDYTIADFVSDLRAPTPSVAAELVVPVKADMQVRLATMKGALLKQHLRLTDLLRERLGSCRRRLPSPGRRIADLRLILDDRLWAMQRLVARQGAFRRQLLSGLADRLRLASPAARIRDRRFATATLKKDMIAAAKGIRQNRKKQLEAAMIMLDTLSPLAVLNRGYSIARTMPSGIVLKDAATLSAKDSVSVTLAKGSFQALVTEIHGSENQWQKKNLKRP